MSFSTELKEEMSKTENLANKEAVKYELMGYLISSNISEQGDKIKFSTESEYNINRFSCCICAIIVFSFLCLSIFF